MLLLIMCCYLEVADRGMTTAIKLVLAQTFVASSTALVRQLMGNCMLHGGPFAQRGPSSLGLHLGAQFLLELLIFTDVQASALPEDRKSTRLNSSHLGISYAVFCL